MNLSKQETEMIYFTEKKRMKNLVKFYWGRVRNQVAPRQCLLSVFITNFFSFLQIAAILEFGGHVFHFHISLGVHLHTT